MSEGRVSTLVAQLRAGVSPVCDGVPPSDSEYGVLTLAAITSGAIRRDLAKRIDASLVKRDWPVLREGTVLVTRGSGSRDLVGACLLVDRDESTLIPPDTAWIIDIAEGHSARFLVEFLRSSHGRKAIYEIARGSNGIWKISQDSFLNVRVPALNRGNEAAVVQLSQVFDDALRGLSALIDAKRTFKRGLMQQLLTGQKRFPEFRNRPWKASTLGDHVRVLTRKNSHGCTLVLTASGEHGLVDQRRYFNRSVAGADLSKYYLLRRGDFAYNRSAMKGYPYGATKRLDEHDEGVLSTLYLCFEITDTNLNSDYLVHVVESGVLNRQLRPIVRVGARAHGLLNVSDEDYLSVAVPFPAIDEQQRIASVLNGIDKELDLLAAQREKVQVYKRALLSRLLSGDLEVPA